MRFARVLSLLALTTVCGCGLWSDTYWSRERYRLVAVDDKAQMELGCEIGDSPVILVGPTVFSIGADDRYIVLKQHPKIDAGHFDRSKTNYFVVERTSIVDGRERMKRVSGPLSEEQFAELKTRLSLPPFSKTFRDLQ